MCIQMLFPQKIFASKDFFQRVSKFFQMGQDKRVGIAHLLHVVSYASIINQ